MDRKKEKVCLFSRVSTNIQDLASQENSLIQAAKSDGYSENNFIIISEHESGVNNSIKDRIGISKAIDAILNQNVRTIYCFELSRIARRLDVFYEFRNFLVEHKVQLIILQPSVKLLNDNGDIDENFSLVFSIFASLAEQEARLLKSRLKRGKDIKRAANKFCDSTVAYGYFRLKDGSISVNEDEAEIVKSIYYDYNSGIIVDDIAKKLISNNILDKSLKQAKNFCFHILHNCIYCGRPTTENKYCNTHVKHGYYYPAIITEEDFDKADSTFKKRKNMPRTKSKNVWFCRGILVNEKGIEYHVHSTNKTYYTVEDTKEYTRMKTIPKDRIDEFVWNLVYENLLYNPKFSKEEQIKNLENKLKESEIKISENKSILSDIDAKIKKIEYRIINGKLNEELGDEMKCKFYREKEKAEKELIEIEANRNALKERLKKISENNYTANREELDNCSDEEKEQYIKEEIKKIVAVKSKKGEVSLLISRNICDDPEFYKINYREYNKKKYLCP